MNGIIPEAVGQSTELYSLDLYGNSWEGIITEVHFQNLTRLKYISLSSTSKSLVFNLRPDWFPSIDVDQIIISDCKLGPAFPTWLRTQKDVIKLILRSCEISDNIPAWFWTFSPQLCWVDLSDNQLKGKLPNKIGFGFKPVLGALVDLGFNHLKGPIPLWSNATDLYFRNNFFSGSIPSNIGYEMSRLKSLDLSRNALIGSIPSSINNMSDLSFLDLSSNYLSGTIPMQWEGIQKLSTLDLSNNDLSGAIPSSICSSALLNWLKLGSNYLSGQPSTSLKNCSDLLYLDLGDNRFSGTVPDMLSDNLLLLLYLGLRGNLLTGSIPDQLCQFPRLQILDLANNNLSGTIPRCMGSMEAFKDTGFYQEGLPTVHRLSFSMHVDLVVKGAKNEYTDIIPLVKFIDLSNNNLSGEIPEEITNLTFLYALNLSWNLLGGKKPDNVGSLKRLETLDLSHNHLWGPIPPTMSSMTFLQVLKLSYNNLSGQIPTGNQFQTFNDPSIYEGNPALCGPPLPNDCSTIDKSITEHEDGGSEDRFEKLWFYTSIGVGFAAGFWAVCGSLVINQSWRQAYFKFVDKMKDRTLTAIAKNMALFCRPWKNNVLEVYWWANDEEFQKS